MFSRQILGSVCGVGALAALFLALVPMHGPGRLAFILGSLVGAVVLPLTEWLLDAARWRAWFRTSDGETSEGKTSK